MLPKQATPSKADLVAGFRHAGLGSGDTVFFQLAPAAPGGTDTGQAARETADLLHSAMREVLGPQGTILLPACTFSFSRNEVFDVLDTPVAPSQWTPDPGVLELLRRAPGAVRSADPMHSVVGLGPKAAALLAGLPHTGFGPDSLPDRLLAAKGKLCGIGGIGFADSFFGDYLEDRAGVPFRYRKLFTGQSRTGGGLRKTGWISSVRIQAANARPDWSRLETKARDENLSRTALAGPSEIVAIECTAFSELASREIARNPWVTVVGPAGDPIALEEKRVGCQSFGIKLPENASFDELIRALWRLPRDIVSDGYDAALRALATQVPMTIHAYPTGTECWSWILPEKWVCHEAYLETLGGRRLFSYADHPLHVVSYSLPFSGEVSREELFAHLHTHPILPDAVPFIYKYYERDWGLCCSRQLKESLRDDRYRVVIKSDFSYGTLKVGEVVVPGASDRSFVLCAHLCHPAMVNDDLSGVVVGLKVMQALQRRPRPRYTYRFVILPETIGSVAYLSQNPGLIPKMKGGLFLEMLGLRNPHALQLSFAGNTELDETLTQVLREVDPKGWTGAFRTVVGNDERQFNAPGVRVPMLSLSRVEPRTGPGEYFYPEYHSSHDTPALASAESLEHSAQLVLRMIEAIEATRIPANRYPGEAFCSRFGINIDPNENPEGHQAFFDIMFLIDGTRSASQIARACGISLQAVNATLAELHRHGLVVYPEPADAAGDHPELPPKNPSA